MGHEMESETGGNETSRSSAKTAALGRCLNQNIKKTLMSRLIVTATASPLFKNFLMLVSVSTDAGGVPKKKLKPTNFEIYHLASLNHASVLERPVAEAKEGPDGFYTLTLKPNQAQPSLPPGHYVFAVVVHSPALVRKGQPPAEDAGQTVAVGDIPA